MCPPKIQLYDIFINNSDVKNIDTNLDSDFHLKSITLKLFCAGEPLSFNLLYHAHFREMSRLIHKLKSFKSQLFGHCREIEQNKISLLAFVVNQLNFQLCVYKSLHYELFTECLDVLKNFTNFLQIIYQQR